MSMAAEPRTLECFCADWDEFGSAACNAAGGWRDKRAQGALGSVGCFCWSFCCVSQCVGSFRNVRLPLIALTLRGVLHIVEMSHVR